MLDFALAGRAAAEAAAQAQAAAQDILEAAPEAAAEQKDLFDLQAIPSPAAEDDIMITPAAQAYPHLNATLAIAQAAVDDAQAPEVAEMLGALAITPNVPAKQD